MTLIVVIATLVFGALFAYPRQWSHGLYSNDEMWNASLARNVYDGRGFVSDTLFALQFEDNAQFPVPEALKQSGYPLLVAAAWALTGVSVRTMIAVAILGLALAAGAVFVLFRTCGFSRRWSVAAAVVFGGSPAIAGTLVAGLPESWFAAVFLTAVIVALRAPSWGAVLSGCLLALAVLIKGHGIIYLPVFAALLALRPRSRIVHLGGFAAAFVALLALAVVLLPAGSVGLFGSAGNYSSAFLIGMSGIETAVTTDVVDPPDALATILQRPFDYLLKYAKMASRTKLLLDWLSAPTLTGVFFPLFLIAMILAPLSLLPAARSWPRPRLAVPESGLPGELVLGWVWCLVAVTLAFFWAIYPTARYWIHVYPLMWLLVLAVARALVPPLTPVRPVTRAIVAAVATYVVCYPPILSLWEAYRQPHAWVGRHQAVRFIDLEALTFELERRLPRDAVVITDLPFEVTWLSRHRTIVFPLEERDFELAVDRYDALAVLEHPELYRDWPMLEEHFELVATGNGRLWLRRGSTARR